MFDSIYDKEEISRELCSKDQLLDWLQKPRQVYEKVKVLLPKSYNSDNYYAIKHVIEWIVFISELSKLFSQHVEFDYDLFYLGCGSAEKVVDEYNDIIKSNRNTLFILDLENTNYHDLFIKMSGNHNFVVLDTRGNLPKYLRKVNLSIVSEYTDLKEFSNFVECTTFRNVTYELRNKMENVLKLKCIDILDLDNTVKDTLIAAGALSDVEKFMVFVKYRYSNEVELLKEHGVDMEELVKRGFYFTEHDSKHNINCSLNIVLFTLNIIRHYNSEMLKLDSIIHKGILDITDFGHSMLGSDYMFAIGHGNYETTYFLDTLLKLFNSLHIQCFVSYSKDLDRDRWLAMKKRIKVKCALFTVCVLNYFSEIDNVSLMEYIAHKYQISGCDTIETHIKDCSSATKILTL